eukprot:m.198732 g.198732  ORF g.198732 m.198732 type:complete len:84 (+) comp21884_c0_seq4:325-576(+)
MQLLWAGLCHYLPGDHPKSFAMVMKRFDIPGERYVMCARCGHLVPFGDWAKDTSMKCPRRRGPKSPPCKGEGAGTERAGTERA